jgi:hypothetical protein
MTSMGYVSSHAPYYRPRHMKFAEPLKKATHQLFGIDHWAWDHFDKPEFAHLKDEPCPEFFSRTPREMYIKMSEEFAKPQVHPQFFGWVARRKIGTANSIAFLFSDSGFIEELHPVIEYVTPASVMIVEIHADGKSFSGDSRGYIGDKVKELYPDITVRKIPNTFGDSQDKELFRVYCRGAVKGFLNIEEKEQ